MTIIWPAFFVTFVMSMLALTYIQRRAARNVPFADKYWRELSPSLRWLLWPGLIAFAVIFGIAVVSVIAQHVR